jgi:twinkle protein
VGDSTFIRHEPCPKCGSKDNLSRYSDGHAYCEGFNCDHYEHADGVERAPRPRNNVKLLEDLEYAPLLKRGITEETCKHLDYQVGRTKRGKCHVANYHNANGRIAQHLRYANKDMPWKGESSEAYLFGQQAWKPGTSSKVNRLIITEGEIDALTVDQCLDHKWPVVAVPGVGHAAQAIARNMDFVDAFDDVVLFFDQDEPGQAAARECAELLQPGKASIVRTFKYHDANEALQARDFEAITRAQWNAQPFWPDDIIESGSEEMFERLIDFKIASDYDYPWPTLNAMARGMRLGEMTMWTAGTGVGKSQTLKDVVLHMMASVAQAGKKIGLILLEESIEITHITLLSMWMGTDPLDWDDIDTERRRIAYKEVFGDGTFLLYDHWGSLESKRLLSKIRSMVRGGCDVVVLDHISIVISGSDEADGGGERRVIDKVMTKLESLVKETQFHLHIISHLKKPDGTPFEEGGQVSMADLRGSGTLMQIPDNIYAVERNTQAEDPKERSRALIRVLKNRLARETGPADTLSFNKTTGRYDVVDDLGFDAEEDPQECEATTSDF